MGVPGLWTILTPVGKSIALIAIAESSEWRYTHHDAIHPSSHSIRIAIDFSIWTFQIRSSRGGANPGLRTLFYRLCLLWRLGFKAIFVLDGPARPSRKRGRIVQTTTPAAARREAEFESLITLFGFPVHRAHGEAEAECAAMQRLGHVDLVLTDDVDAFLFGASAVMRNWTSKTEKLGSSDSDDNEGESAGKGKGKGKDKAKSKSRQTHITIIRADDIRNHLDLDREGLILIALLSGSDYVPDGAANVGIQTAVALARGGWGRRMCEIVLNGTGSRDFAGLRQEIELELATNSSGLLERCRPSVRLPDDFPNEGIIRSYLTPHTAIEGLGDNFAFQQDGRPDLAALAVFCRDKFLWEPNACMEKLVRCLFPGVAIWDLRQPPASLAAKPISDSQARPHGESQDRDPITRIWSQRVKDGVTEVRVEWSDTVIGSFAHEASLHLSQAKADDLTTASPLSAQPDTPSFPVSFKRHWISAGLAKVLFPSQMRAFEARGTKRAGQVSGVGKRPKGKGRARATMSLGIGKRQLTLPEIMASHTAREEGGDEKEMYIVISDDEDCEVIDLTK